MTNSLEFWTGYALGFLSIFGMAGVLIATLFWEWLHSVNGISRLVDLAKKHGG